MKKLALPLMVVITLVSLGIGMFSYLRWRPSRPAVTVGGQRISEYDYKQAMEMQSGPAVMKKLVYTDLVRQAAAQQNVMPTSADVETRLADMIRQKPALAGALKNEELARQTRSDLTTELALENLRIKGITASDAEVNAFYSANHAALSVPGQTQTTMVVAQNRDDASSAEHLLTINAAPEVIARSPRLHVAGVGGFNADAIMQAVDPATRTNIGNTVMSMSPGQIKTIAVGNLFMTFKVKSKSQTVTPPLSQVHDQVVRFVKLKKAVSPQQELASLYAASTPSFNNDRYKAFFSDIENYNAQNAGKKKVASNP